MWMHRFMTFVAAVLLLLAGAIAARAQDEKDTSSADVDGPYLFEDAGTWVAKRIVLGDSKATAEVEKLKGAEPEIEVRLPGRDAPLKVRIRPEGTPPPGAGPAPERILALSDIEGNFDALVKLLRAGGAIDDELRWTLGKGHLVFVGDLFDRGLHVTECLWLFYELQARAEAAGGAIHFILGNHEVMNLTGDLRYARKKYRENAALLGEKLEDLYSRRTVLGRWLRTRNAIQRLGDELFVHGGISPAVAEAKVTIDALNDALRKGLLADTWPKPRDAHLKLVTDSKVGLIWYRGYIKDPIDEKSMDAILAAFGARRVVVGHTMVEKIDYVLGGRVLAIDVHHAKGVNQAALFERGAWHRLLPDGKVEKLEAAK